MKISIVLILILYCYNSFVNSSIAPNVIPISDQIYVQINYAYPCVRLLTENGQFGCSSKLEGNSGFMYLIDSDQSLSDYMNSPRKDVILVLDSNYFNKTVVGGISKKTPVNGIIVLSDAPRNYSYSPDVQYPNKKYGLYPNSNLQWNPIGDSFSYQQFNFPIFATDFNYSVALRNLSSQNREGNYPAFGAELRSFMQANQNAETCLRRGFCVPIGGKSVWGTFSEEIKTTDDIILVMVPMDSTAFFHDMATGADQTSYATVVLYSIIETLSRADHSKWNMKVVFALWNGERWGYTGSSKFINDLLQFNCQEYSPDGTYCINPMNYDLSFRNITFDNIKYIIELNQIGKPEIINVSKDIMKAKYYLHTTNDVNSKSLITLFNSMNTDGNETIVQFSPTTASEIPPSSTMSFLKMNSNIPHIILTDHDQAYRNPFYASHDDDVYNIETQPIGDIILTLSSIIDQLAGGTGQNLTLNDFFYATMFSCLLESFTCSYVDQLLATYPYNPIPNYYASVYGTNPYNQFYTIQSTFFLHLMLNLTAYSRDNITDPSQFCKKDADCSNILPGANCLINHCVLSNSHYHDSISLGLTFDEKVYSYVVSNSSYPIFVESNWDYTNLRVYQLSNPTHEILFLVFGILEFIIVSVVILLIKKYLSKKYKLL